jgi:hypothetical protein
MSRLDPSSPHLTPPTKVVSTRTTSFKINRAHSKSFNLRTRSIWFSKIAYVKLNNPGDFLLSHAATRAVPSAPRGLTSVFGMGTGVTLSTESPENLKDPLLLLKKN